LCAEGGIPGFLSYTPYSGILKAHWSVTHQDLERITKQSKTYKEFYQGLREVAGCITNKNAGLIDKTPGYFYRLQQLIDATEDVPIIIMRKNPRNHFCSMKARGWKVERFISWYKNHWSQEKIDIINLVPRIKIVQFEDFLLDPKPILKDICKMMQIKYCEKDYERILSTFRSDEMEKYNSSFPYRGPHSKKNKGKQTLTRSEIEKINTKLKDLVVV